MNLFDPSRPRVGHKPALLPSGLCVLNHLEVFPLEEVGMVKLSCFLPLRGEGFAAKRFEVQVKEERLPELIRSFRQDPEACLLSLYDISDGMLRPALGQEPSDRALGAGLRKTREAKLPKLPSLPDPSREMSFE